jgi:hypothetical protein
MRDVVEVTTGKRVGENFVEVTADLLRIQEEATAGDDAEEERKK